MKKSELQQIIKEEIQNTLKAYGHQDIKNLYKNLKPGEDVYLDDSASGELTGEIVKKSEYLEKTLEKAIKNKDWSMVMNAVSYLRNKF